MKNILVISDNEQILTCFKHVVQDQGLSDRYSFEYKTSPGSRIYYLPTVKADRYLVGCYDMVFSLHCTQIFPAELVEKVKCVNLHPGLNPCNRGWFPQTFAIIENMPCGATLHEMDARIDHGGIIAQKGVDIEMYDTSKSVYEKILKVEKEILEDYLEYVLGGEYETYSLGEGHLHTKKEFNELCRIELQDVDTFSNHLKLLRALSFEPYKNAYFVDDKGREIYIRLKVYEPTQHNTRV